MQSVTLTPMEVDFPVARTLDSGLIEEYNEEVQLGYNDKNSRENLLIFQDRDGELAGSNCFAPIELRRHLLEGTRLATMADLGRATEINPKFLEGFYSDTGLILRTAGDSYGPNNELAKDLAEQFEHRGMPLKEGMARVVYFDALGLQEDEDSSYGISYVLGERADEEELVFDSQELMQDSYTFTTTDARGVPIPDADGTRTCYTRKDGLSGFCLDRFSDVGSYYGVLACSGDSGRVVGVSAGGARA